MAIVVVNYMEGASQDLYDKVSEKVMPGGQLPEGCQVHIAGPVKDGWRVITVWGSQEQWQQFRNKTLIPTIREVGGDDAPSPKVNANPVHRLVTA
jgi:hypothetical protein